MHLAVLSPIAWRTPPTHYGPWERVVSLLVEGLVRRGVEVTLFATADSETKANLHAVVPRPYEEDKDLDPKVWECLHISELFERAEQFDLIHNHYDFLPLTYSGLVSTPVLTTIHGFSSSKILPVYKKYNGRTHYVSISNADRSPELDYVATVHHGIDLESFTFNDKPNENLLFFGRIHPDKGTRQAIEIARLAGMDLIIAGIVQDRHYFETEVEPHIDGVHVRYVGSADPRLRDKLLGEAYALLHPIDFNEPFGLSIVEANACGTPVIAFRRGSMPELVTDGVNGFLVSDVSEAVEAIRQIGTVSRRACREIAERKFSRDRMVDEYLSVYSEILAKGHRENHRPWGYYEVLSDSEDHKVKRIVVSPGKRLSLQQHSHRSEHWMIVKGAGVVTRGSEDIELKSGEAVDIPKGTRHRVLNTGEEPLVFIEIQTGDYFGENDIERFEDDFGRV
jgi:mannose-6-phosphate isomerase-like protein (cupin superfamily)